MSTAWKDYWENGSPNEINKLILPNITSCHTAYYQMRKVALVRLHPEAQLQQLLNSIFSASSRIAIRNIAHCCGFLLLDEARHLGARVRHLRGLISSDTEKEEPLRPAFALLQGSALADHYQYVLDAVLARMDQGKDFLEG